jgi:hypothetical protein
MSENNTPIKIDDSSEGTKIDIQKIILSNEIIKQQITFLRQKIPVNTEINIVLNNVKNVNDDNGRLQINFENIKYNYIPIPFTAKFLNSYINRYYNVVFQQYFYHIINKVYDKLNYRITLNRLFSGRYTLTILNTNEPTDNISNPIIIDETEIIDKINKIINDNINSNEVQEIKDEMKLLFSDIFGKDFDSVKTYLTNLNLNSIGSMLSSNKPKTAGYKKGKRTKRVNKKKKTRTRTRKSKSNL